MLVLRIELKQKKWHHKAIKINCSEIQGERTMQPINNNFN